MLLSASHQPKSLQGQSIRSVVAHLYSTILPSRLVDHGFHICPNPDCMCSLPKARSERREPFHQNLVTLDNILVTVDLFLLSQYSCLKKDLMLHLRNIAKWKNDNWPGSRNSQLRSLIHEAFQEFLEWTDFCTLSPLFKILLQLILCLKVGHLPETTRLRLGRIYSEFPYKLCPNISDVINQLGPFGIEELYTTGVIFGDPSPVVTIICNSPFLKKVHLKYSITDASILALGEHCNKLEVIVVEQLLGSVGVSEDALYRAFFKGRTKSDILECINSGEEVVLSFSSLRCIDIGSSSTIQQFFVHFLHFYRKIQTVTCNSEVLDLVYLLSRSSSRDSVYSLHNFAVTDRAIINSSDKVPILYPEVDTILLSLEGKQTANFYNQIKDIISSLNCSNIALTVATSSVGCNDLIPVYTSVIGIQGPCIKSLKLHLSMSAYYGFIKEMLLLCPYLTYLEMVIDAKYAFPHDEVNLSEDNPQVLNLPLIQKLSISSKSHLKWGGFEIFEIAQFPNLACLEYKFFPTTASDFSVCPLLNMAKIGKLDNLQILEISCCKEVILARLMHAKFFVDLIQSLPSLSVLVIGAVHAKVLWQLQKMFSNTQLKITGKEYSHHFHKPLYYMQYM